MITVQNRNDFLYYLRKYLPPSSIGVELGVLYGDFSQQILDIIKPERLILVDPYEVSERRYGPDPGELATAYSTEEDYQKVINRFESVRAKVIVVRKYSYEATEYISYNSLDFVYIDACHLYEDVKRDLQDWLPKLKEGGLMCGHDYTGNYKEYVIKAVDEFCKEYNFEMIIFNENGGDYALKRQ